MKRRLEDREHRALSRNWRPPTAGDAVPEAGLRGSRTIVKLNVEIARLSAKCQNH